MKFFFSLALLCACALPAQSGGPSLTRHASMRPSAAAGALPLLGREPDVVREAHDAVSASSDHPEIGGAALACIGAAICFMKRRRPLQ